MFVSNTFEIIAAQRIPTNTPLQLANNPSSQTKLSEANLRIKLACNDLQVVPLKNVKSYDDDDENEENDDQHPLQTQVDYQYTIDFLVGSNKQKMTLLVDTGSQRAWIPTIDCKEGQCPKYSHWFNYSESKTLSIPKKSVQTIEYLSGEIQGYDGKDFIKIKDSSITEALVPIIFSFKVDQFIFTNFDGVFGLPNRVKTKSLIDLLSENQILENSKFTLQLARYPQPLSSSTSLIQKTKQDVLTGQITQEEKEDDDEDEDDEDKDKEDKKNDEEESEDEMEDEDDLQQNYKDDQYLSDLNSYLYLGQGIPSAILNKTNWIDITSTTQWKSIMIGLEHKDNDLIDELDIHNYEVYFESGTTFTLFPKAIKRYIEGKLKEKGCEKSENNRIILCDCNKKNYPVMKMYLRGAMLVIDETVYFNRTGPTHKKQCLFNILTSPENHDYVVFGSSLLRKYPVTFDKENQKIGFYNSRQIHYGSDDVNSTFVLLFLINLVIFGGLLFMFYETIRQEKIIKGEDDLEEIFFQELEVYSNRSSFNSTHSRMFNPTLLDEQSFNNGYRYCDMIKIQ